MKLKIDDGEKNLLYPILFAKVQEIRRVLKQWDLLPAGTMVNNLEGHFVARAREELPMYEALLYRIQFGDKEPEPVLDLDEEDISYTKGILNAIHEAKYYTDQATDNLLLLRGQVGFRIGDKISEVYQELEVIESQIHAAYPQIQEE